MSAEKAREKGESDGGREKVREQGENGLAIVAFLKGNVFLFPTFALTLCSRIDGSARNFSVPTGILQDTQFSIGAWFHLISERKKDKDG